jgi:hypothetical protein
LDKVAEAKGEAHVAEMPERRSQTFIGHDNEPIYVVISKV